ncbi:class I SAM-dependent methyltransferase [Actinoplanes sichuanensis]|uniref:Class I SAM-dependent methyltransferase n=1 Tax=Actinoplanes sichuanensis TaxID=512349 RepID=A0ABW4AUZ7_9ACTN|nr:class I SAM-dependent methyltransferase [Actinoplanes sichuanensis]BEL04632.1 class I SAM-dependent methyltransferase [Actinoplanes sichuanensis]
MSSDLHAASFGSAAAAYERGRPPYPAEAVAWAVPSQARRVLDLGAGTGKLTRALLAAGFHVDAVEPSPEMRDQLAVSAGQASIFEGTGENVPLPDASVDAVVCAQAWHWVDPARAVPEMARVLRPGGTLALIWNIRDHTEPWVAALDDVLHRHTRQEIDTAPPIGGPFSEPEHTEFRWRHTLNRTELLDMVTSRSYVILLSETDRQALLDGVLALADSHGLGDEFDLPYVTRCTRARLR